MTYFRNSQPPTPAVHTSRRQNDESSLYVEIPLEPPQPTIASLAAARSVTPDTLLRTAALGLHHSPMMAPHLKFGMLVSFALATLFLAGAKYYFDRQVSDYSYNDSNAPIILKLTYLANLLARRSFILTLLKQKFNNQKHLHHPALVEGEKRDRV